MTILQIIEESGGWAWVTEHPGGAVLVVLGVMLCGTVTVKRLELPVYQWARDWINARLAGIGRRFNAQVAADVAALTGTVRTLTETVESLHARLQEQEATADRRRADDYRRELLSFNREIMEGRHPDRESYVEALAIIDRYHEYCREHPDYPNSRADAAIRNIKIHYDKCLKIGFYKEDT